MKQKIWPWVMAIAALIIGSYGLYSRLFLGHLANNYGNYVTWGLWVSTYLYFIGLSVGSFLIGSIFKQVRKISRLVALGAYIGGLLAIWLDLGHMGRFYRALVSPNFSSPISWLVWFYCLYFILLVWSNYRYFWKNEEENKELTFLGVIIVLAVILSSSFLFALNMSKPFWNTAILPLLFLGAALTSGGALLILSGSVMWFEDKNLLVLLKRLVLYSLALTAFIEFSEILLVIKDGIPEHYEVARSLLIGRYAWPFWFGIVLLAFVLPVGLLLPLYSNGAKTLAGCISILVGFFVLRFLFVIPAQGVAHLKGLENSIMEPRYSYNYIPSIEEWLIVIFLFGLVTAILLAGIYKAKYLELVGERDKEAKINV